MMRVLVRIDEVIIDAADDAEIGNLEADVRAGIAAAFSEGALPPAFGQNAPLLEATHSGGPGIGTAIAAATPPGSLS